MCICVSWWVGDVLGIVVGGSGEHLHGDGDGDGLREAAQLQLAQVHLAKLTLAQLLDEAQARVRQLPDAVPPRDGATAERTRPTT